MISRLDLKGNYSIHVDIISVVFFLKFWAYEILPKFWRNFQGETFGKFWDAFVAPSSPPPAPTKKREKLYILHCEKFTINQNFDNTIGYFLFRRLKLFWRRHVQF